MCKCTERVSKSATGGKFWVNGALVHLHQRMCTYFLSFHRRMVLVLRLLAIWGISVLSLPVVVLVFLWNVSLCAYFYVHVYVFQTE